MSQVDKGFVFRKGNWNNSKKRKNFPELSNPRVPEWDQHIASFCSFTLITTLTSSARATQLLIFFSTPTLWILVTPPLSAGTSLLFFPSLFFYSFENNVVFFRIVNEEIKWAFVHFKKKLK